MAWWTIPPSRSTCVGSASRTRSGSPRASTSRADTSALSGGWGSGSSSVGRSRGPRGKGTPSRGSSERRRRRAIVNSMGLPESRGRGRGRAPFARPRHRVAVRERRGRGPSDGDRDRGAPRSPCRRHRAEREQPERALAPRPGAHDAAAGSLRGADGPTHPAEAAPVHHRRGPRDRARPRSGGRGCGRPGTGVLEHARRGRSRDSRPVAAASRAARSPSDAEDRGRTWPTRPAASVPIVALRRHLHRGRRTSRPRCGRDRRFSCTRV